MAYAFVQETGTSTNNARTPALTVSAGDSILIAVGLSATSGTFTIDDGGLGNTYVALTNTASPLRSVYGFFCASSAGGASTGWQVTSVAGNVFRTWVGEYSGLGSTVLGVQSNYQNGGGIGANVITAPLINLNAVPAMLWGFVIDNSFTEKCSAGTSPIAFTGRDSGNLVTQSRPEDARITVSGNAQVTFGNTATHDYMVISAAIGEPGVGVQTPPQCGRTIYILP